MFKQIARIQVYFQSLAFYTGVVNTLIGIATMKKVYDINISIFLLIPIAITIGAIVGVLDYHLIRKHFFTVTNKNNDLKKQLDRIEKKLQEA